MDDITRERYPHGVPSAEQRARPQPKPVPLKPVAWAPVRPATSEQIAARLAVLLEGDNSFVRAMRRGRSLVEAIRRAA